MRVCVIRFLPFSGQRGPNIFAHLPGMRVCAPSAWIQQGGTVPAPPERTDNLEKNRSMRKKGIHTPMAVNATSSLNANCKRHSDECCY